MWSRHRLGHFGSKREYSLGFVADWCVGDNWIEIGVVSRRTDQFEMSLMLQVIDEQVLLMMERKTHFFSGVGLGSGVSLKDKLPKINDQILDLKRCRSGCNDETRGVQRGEKWWACAWRVS